MVIQNKIYDLDELAKNLDSIRAENKKIVCCHGCFDLLHIGHIRHFRQAKEYGEVLIVTVTPDKFFDKGPDRPIFNEQYRAEAIASQSVVDYVAINKWPTFENTLELLKPHYYAKGSEFKWPNSDYTGKIESEIKMAERIGAKVIFTEDIVFSSSNLINQFLSDKPSEIKEYLSLLRSRYTIDQLTTFIDKMETLKVAVIGDTIIDDYQYCNALGKSSKDPVLALHFHSNDIFLGGALSVANHVAKFAGEVSLFATIGEYDTYEEFIRRNLDPKIEFTPFTHPNTPTLVKRRFIDNYSFNKLFEIYIMDSACLPQNLDQQFCKQVEESIENFDLVIASDFGHGTISDLLVHTLCNRSSFLAVNTQANAGNRGFHTISRYPRANLVCLAEHEIRLEKRQPNKNLRVLMDEVSESLSTKYLIVTRGRKGSLLKGMDGTFISSPSITKNVVDRVGAGDTFFAIAAMAAAMDVDAEIIAFLGNLVGGMAVEIIGNKKMISKMKVKKYLTSLLK